jgi:hypothetical protein
MQALKCAPFGPVVLGIARPLVSGKEADKVNILRASILVEKVSDKSNAHDQILANNYAPVFSRKLRTKFYPKIANYILAENFLIL